MTLADYLTIWAEWMHADDGPEREPGVAAGFSEARSNYATSVEDSANVSDMREATYGPIIDACIESMPVVEKLAIHHVFGFSRHMRVAGTNTAVVFRDCQPRLAALVRKRLPLDDYLTTACGS